jgi:hypothetical protein
MHAEPTRVAIVVEPDFGDLLLDLSKKRHVWLVDTPPNRARAEDIWRVRHDYSRNEGVTTFKIDLSGPPQEWLLDVLHTIDEHHGLRAEWSSDVELEVRGVHLTNALREALLTFGPFAFEESPQGFIARRRP